MRSNNTKQAGFTLIEIIVGIVMLAISLSVLYSLIVPAEQQSADQIQQIKASELAQGLMDDILSRAFDEKSDMAGSQWRCNEPSQPSCSSSLGKDSGETSRDSFDDVDDFNGFNQKIDAVGTGLDQSYTSFTLDVTVIYAGGELGLANALAKRITITVTTPLGTDIKFSGYKANF